MLEFTVVALGVLAGDVVQASAVLLPEATAVKTPAATRFVVAVLIELRNPPPRLMLATAGRIRFAATQLMPEITPVQVPEP